MKFNEKVYKIVMQIPKGKVATYGQIAALMGSPRAARQVGWALHQLDTITSVPWYKIINRHGMISTTCHEHTPKIQKQLLERENIKVKKIDGQFYIDLDKYIWHPKKA